MAVITKGEPYLFGLVDEVEIHPEISGQVRVRMRSKEFMKMFIRTVDGISEWTVILKDGFLSPGLRINRNVRVKE